jgi:hypothetical protein
VEGQGIASDLIEMREGTVMPFTPSHVEAVDGDKYLGQHMSGGFQARSAGYDAPFKNELFIDLPATGEQTVRFYQAAWKSVGQSYDWNAILGFELPGHFHEKFHAICSAKIFLLLRDNADWFPSHVPLCVPAHDISPRDLLLIISAIVEVPH